MDAAIGSQLSRYDLSGLNLDGASGGIVFMDLVMDAVAGRLDFSMQGVLDTITGLFLDTMRQNVHLIRQLLIVAVLSAVIRCLAESFQRKAAGEIGFYVSFMMMVLLAFSSFRISVGVLTDLVSALSAMMEASVPLMIGVLAMSGSVTGAAVFHPLLAYGAQLITRLVSHLFIPMVIAAAVLTVVNCLAEGAVLSRWAALIKKGADWMLKGILALFMMLLALQKFSAPAVDNAAIKTARAAANAIPVVGGAVGAAMDTVVNWGAVARSSVMVALVVVICAAVALPLLQILAVVLVYRLVAAMIQPICDDRIIGCLDGIGTFTGMLLVGGTLVALMFVLTALILLS